MVEILPWAEMERHVMWSKPIIPVALAGRVWKMSAMLKSRKGKSDTAHPLPKVVGSGRWADCCLLSAAVVPELIFARLGQRVPLG